MPEWLVERGIGEQRAARIVDGEIVESRILIDGMVRAGTRVPARLKAIRPRAMAEAEGQEYLLPKGAPGKAEGATVVIEVTRENIPGSEPWKRPLAIVTEESPGNAPMLDAEPIMFPAPKDMLAAAGWLDLLDEARTGIVQFSGGELRISPTPAMTLIDVDGHLAADELAVAGASAAAKAIRRLDIGGSIGLDLPTTRNKAARKAAAAAVDASLPQPFERAAVNGFGFLQIVRPRARGSLIDLAQDRASFEARALLRLAAFEPAGPKRLVGHPAVTRILEQRRGWLSDLEQQVGGAVSLRSEPSLTISGGYVETP